MIGPRSVALQGVGFEPLAVASQGFLGSGLLVDLNGIPVGVQLGPLTLSFAGQQNIILGAVQAVVGLGRHGFGVPAPLAYLWKRLSHSVTRSVTRLVEQWRSG